MSGQVQQLTIAQDNKIKKLEGELARKTFLEERKEKQITRLFNQNNSMRTVTKELLDLVKNKHEEVVLDQETNDLMSKLSNMVKFAGNEAATAVDE